MIKVAVAGVAIAGIALQIVWAVALIAPVVYLVGAAAGFLVGF